VCVITITNIGRVGVCIKEGNGLKGRERKGKEGRYFLRQNQKMQVNNIIINFLQGICYYTQVFEFNENYIINIM